MLILSSPKITQWGKCVDTPKLKKAKCVNTPKLYTSDVYTDNNPLVHVMSTRKLNAAGQRWENELNGYTFTIHYKSGVENTAADAF